MLHYRKIWLQSSVGKGSTFYFTVNSTPVHDTAEVVPSNTPSHKELIEILPAPLTILIVDDNVISQRILEANLRNLGHTVTKVQNGEEAVLSVEHHDFDVVLMDCQMPTMDGFEATELIRKSEVETSSNRLPIVALTAHALVGYEELCLKAGMDGYVTKPVDFLNLLKTIRTVVETDGQEEIGCTTHQAGEL